jgi:hypothetical protein
LRFGGETPSPQGEGGNRKEKRDRKREIGRKGEFFYPIEKLPSGYARGKKKGSKPTPHHICVR